MGWWRSMEASPRDLGSYQPARQSEGLGATMTRAQWRGRTSGGVQGTRYLKLGQSLGPVRDSAFPHHDPRQYAGEAPGRTRNGDR